MIRSNASIPSSALSKRFILIYLPIAVIFSAALLSSVHLDEQRRAERTEVSESARVAIAQGLITQDFSAAISDLHVLMNLPPLKEYLDNGDPALRETLSQYFLVLSRETQRYDQVRYLDSSGHEIIRINYIVFPTRYSRQISTIPLS